MTGARSSGARKSMRAIPLTQRQRKQGKPDSKASQRARSVSLQGKSARGPRGGRPALVTPTPPTTPTVRPSAPLDPNAESDVPLAPATPKAPAKKTLDARKRSAAPTVETRPMVMTPAPKTDALPSAPHDEDTPRRVKVRVRRKRPTPAPLSAAPERAMELAETTVLPSVRLASPSTPSRAVPDSAATPLSPDATGAPLAAMKAEAEPPVGAPAADDTRAPETPAVEDIAPVGAPAGPVEAPPPEPRQPVTTRKLPTLAVMAALATRAEARAESGALEDLDATNGAEATDEETPPASKPEASASPESGAGWMTDAAAPAVAPAPEEPIASVTRPRAARPAPASQPGAPASTAAPGEPSSSGRRRLWWLNSPQVAQEIRDGQDGQGEQGEPERRDDPAAGRDPRVTRPVEAARAPIAPQIASIPTQPRPRPVAPPVTLPPAPRIAPSTPRQADRWREATHVLSRPRRAEPSGARARVVSEDIDAPPLIWVGGVEAALCGAAALVAVIALLNGTAGARAVAVFGWAMTFALIAGAGAGLGHLAGQMKRPRLAALALVLSQMGLLAWALALLGARPALLTLAPFTVALALRGLGRWVAVSAVVATLALYALALTLDLTSAWLPAATFAPGLTVALDTTLVVVGMALTALALASLYAAGERERSRTRAIEHTARLVALELDGLRWRTEDDADALRRALSAALRGVPTEGARAEGALSPLAEQVNVVAERLVELSHDREERKRLESATRRLIRNIERAWLGLSWSWPEASGVIVDDLVALLRTPPPSGPSQLPEDTTPTGQVVAPHLYRAWRPGDSLPSQPLTPQPSLWPDRASPSQSSGVWPSLWPSDPEPAAPGTDPLALPPSPRWRGPDDEPRARNSASGLSWPGGGSVNWPPGMSRPGW